MQRIALASINWCLLSSREFPHHFQRLLWRKNSHAHTHRRNGYALWRFYAYWARTRCIIRGDFPHVIYSPRVTFFHEHYKLSVITHSTFPCYIHIYIIGNYNAIYWGKHFRKTLNQRKIVYWNIIQANEKNWCVNTFFFISKFAYQFVV